MKNLLLFIVAVLFCSGIEAQDNKIQKDRMHDAKMMQMKEYLKMKDGKVMMMMKDGNMMMLDKEMKMSNGAMVSPNGMVKMKDGKTMMMKNGEKMDMDGMMMEKMEMKKDKK